MSHQLQFTFVNKEFEDIQTEYEHTLPILSIKTVHASKIQDDEVKKKSIILPQVQNQISLKQGFMTSPPPIGKEQLLKI